MIHNICTYETNAALLSRFIHAATLCSTSIGVGDTDVPTFWNLMYGYKRKYVGHFFP